MTLARYVEGLLLLCVAFIPVGAAARAWRRRLFPGWVGSAACLAEIIIGVAAVVVLAEVVGAVHLFRLGAVVPVMAFAGAIGWWAARRSMDPAPGTDEPAGLIPAKEERTLPTGATVAAIVTVSLLVADWATRTVDALHHGMTTADTLWYHMPFAARFVQQGTIVPLHYIDADAVTVFFPASSELFHALGIMFMGNDVLSPFVNLGWMALALLAAWCVGRPFGVAPVTVTGAAALLATPGLVATQPGGAYDDVVGLALLLSCTGLLVIAATAGERSRLNGQAVAALAAGVALGTKFTFIAPVVSMSVGIAVVARRGRRLPEVGLWVLLVAVTGGFWYLRNLVVVGNPIPSLKVRIGPLALPSPTIAAPSSTFAHFILKGSDWRGYFFPGLRLSFGPAWWALLALAAAGLVLGVAAGSGRMPKMLAWVGLVTAAAFVVTPQYLTTLGAPVYFVDNVRYLDPAIVIGLVLLPLVPRVRVGRRPWLVLGAFAGTMVVTQLDGTIWPTSWLDQRFAPPIGGLDSLAGFLIGVITLAVGLLAWLGRRRKWRPPLLGTFAISIALVAGGFSVQQFYLRNRYTSSDSKSIVDWAQTVSHARIGVAGNLTQLQYGFYGRDLTNFVQYVGQTGPHRGYSPITNCESWRRAVNSGHYDYVVTSTISTTHRQEVFANPSSYTLWTSSDPASTLLRRSAFVATNGRSATYVGFSLFRLSGELDPDTCGLSPASVASP